MEDREDREDREAGEGPPGQTPGGSLSFSRLSGVASGWMLDFLFLGLVRNFKEGRLEEFSEQLDIFQAFSRSPSLQKPIHQEKTMICAFLSRVIHGEHLDVEFDEDESITPLMSAARVWSDLQGAVADDALFDNISALLFVQAVALCLKEGRKAPASSVLQWFQSNIECPQKLQVKLSNIVAQEETGHPFLTSFSFSRLLEAVQSFLDQYLDKHPSDFLLKEAAKRLQSSPNPEDVASRESPPSEPPSGSRQKKESSSKRRLLSTKLPSVWIPDSNKKLVVSVSRVSVDEVSRPAVGVSADRSTVQRKRKTREKWTPQQDQLLRRGVRRHGVGRWSLILKDFDFEGRTGTMLKDRWRNLTKKNPTLDN